MSGHVINVGINLKTTSGSVAPIISSLQNQLKGKPIHIPIKIDIRSIKTSDIINQNTAFKALSNTLHSLATNAMSSAKAMSMLNSTLGNIQKNIAGISQLPKQASAANQQVTSLGKGMKDAGVYIATFAENVAITTKRFAAFTFGATILYSITSGFYAATKAAVEFDREMVRFKQVSGDSESSIKGIEREISRLSVTWGVSSGDLAKSAVIIKSAGYSARETKIALESLAKTTLSASFDDLASTTEGVIAIMAQFKGGASALEGQLGMLSKISADYAVESRDLVEVIKRAGGAFAATGGSLEELLALFTSIRATTRESAESIATGMRTILGRLEDPEIAARIKKNFHIELYDNGKFIGYYNAIDKLGQVIRALPQGDIRVGSLIKDIGGLRNLSRVIPLLTQFPMAEEVKKAAGKGADKLSEDAIIAQQALLTQVTRVKEGFLDLFRTIAQDSSIRFVLKNVADLLVGISQTLKTIQPLVPILAGVATVAAAKYTLRNFGAIKSGFATGRYGVPAVSKFAGGGIVPGSGNTDSVPALLTPGEAVIPKNIVQGFASGGPIIPRNYDSLRDRMADVLRRPEGRAIYKHLRGSTYLAHGSDAIAFKSPTGTVFRFGSQQQRPVSKYMLQPYNTNVYGNHMIEELPFAPPLSETHPFKQFTRAELNRLQSNGKNPEHIQHKISRLLHKRLEKEGFSPFDVTPKNIARYKGKIIAIDPETLGFARGGAAMGTDTVPAMLTPGEFVLSKTDVRNLGGAAAVDRMRKLARGVDQFSRLESKYGYDAAFDVTKKQASYEAGLVGKPRTFTIGNENSYAKAQRIIHKAGLKRSLYESMLEQRGISYSGNTPTSTLRDIIRKRVITGIRGRMTPLSGSGTMVAATESFVGKIRGYAFGGPVDPLDRLQKHFNKLPDSHPLSGLDVKKYVSGVNIGKVPGGLGSFDPTTRGITLKKFNLKSALHEVGHAVDYAHGVEGKFASDIAGSHANLVTQKYVSGHGTTAISSIGKGSLSQYDPSEYNKEGFANTFASVASTKNVGRIPKSIKEASYELGSSMRMGVDLSASHAKYPAATLQNLSLPSSPVPLPPSNNPTPTPSRMPRGPGIISSNVPIINSVPKPTPFGIPTITSSNPNSTNSPVINTVPTPVSPFPPASPNTIPRASFSGPSIPTSNRPTIFPSKYPNYSQGQASAHFGLNNKPYGTPQTNQQINTYSYNAKSATGKDVSGRIQAATAGYAKTLVESQGNFAVSLKKLDMSKGAIKRTFESLAQTYKAADTQVQNMTGGRLFKASTLKTGAKLGLGVAAAFAPTIAESYLGTAKQPGVYGAKGARAGSAIGGAVTGGATGAFIGMQVGGPVGAAVGGLTGAIVGAIGAVKGFDEELRGIRLEEFEKNISKINYNSRGEFSTKGDEQHYQKSINSALPSMEEIRNTERSDLTQGKLLAKLPFSSSRYEAEIDKTRTDKKTALFQYADKDTKERLSNFGLESYKKIAQANPELSHEQIIKKGGTTKTAFGDLGLSDLLRLAPENLDIAMNYQQSVKKAKALQDKLNGMAEESVVIYEALQHNLEEYEKSVHNAAEGFTQRGAASNLAGTALQGQVGGIHSNLTAGNLKDPFSQDLHGFAKEGGGYDQARQHLIKLIGTQGRNVKAGQDNSLKAGQNIADQFGASGVGGAMAKPIQQHLQTILSGTTDLGQAVQGGGAADLADKVLAPFKGTKETYAKTNSQLNDVYQKNQQAQASTLNRRFQLDQNISESQGLTTEQALNQSSMQTLANPYSTSSSKLTANRGKYSKEYQTVGKTAEERELERNSQIQKSGFLLSQSQILSGTGLENNGGNASALKAGIGQENTNIAKLSVQQDKVQKSGSVQEFNDLGKEILNSQDRMRRLSTALDNLGKSTIDVDVAQKKYSIAVDKYQADFNSRTKDADTLTFGSKKEQKDLYKKEALTQHVLQNYSPEQFQQLPDSVRKQVGERLKETEGQVRTFEQYDKYGRFKGTKDISSTDAIDNLRQPAMSQLQSGASQRLAQGVNSANRGRNNALQGQKEAQGASQMVNEQNINKSTQDNQSNFTQYLADINKSIADQMASTSKFLENSASLVDAMNSFPRNIEITRSGQVEVILNGGALILAAKEQIESEVMSQIIDKLKTEMAKANKKDPAF